MRWLARLRSASTTGKRLSILRRRKKNAKRRTGASLRRPTKRFVNSGISPSGCRDRKRNPGMNELSVRGVYRRYIVEPRIELFETDDPTIVGDVKNISIANDILGSPNGWVRA